MNRREYIAVTGTTGIVGLAGCLGGESSSNSENNSSENGSGNPDSDKFIRYLGWGGNTQESIKKLTKQWTEETGVEVKHQSAGGNAEFLSIIQQNPGSIDLFLPSSSGIVNARENDLLAEIDYSKIPNYTENLEKKWREAPPYMGKDVVFRDWLTIGLGYNSNKIKKIDSWDVLTRESFKGQTSTWDLGYLRFGQGAFPAGYTINELPDSDKKLQETTKILKKQHQNISKYWTSPAQAIRLLREGNVAVSEIFGGRVRALQQDGNEHIHYAVPDEGAILGDENYCIPKSSKKKDLVHKFLDYSFKRKNARQLSLDVGYPIPLKDTPQKIKQLPDYVDSPDKVTFRKWNKITPVQDEWSRKWQNLQQKWS